MEGFLASNLTDTVSIEAHLLTAGWLAGPRITVDLLIINAWNHQQAVHIVITYGAIIDKLDWSLSETYEAVIAVINYHWKQTDSYHNLNVYTLETKKNGHHFADNIFRGFYSVKIFVF